MKKVFILSLISFLITFAGCSGEKNSKEEFNLEDLKNSIENKGYNFELQDVQKDFLPTTRKRMVIDDIAIDIYIFSSNKKMEREASYIDSDGSGYNNGRKAIKVSWISSPHFYKKGSLIVQYVGENVTIISDLEDILGEQFVF